MPGITFGSVGDIISAGQIAWALCQALRQTNGSARSYQGLVRELEAFDKALLQVIALWQNYEESPELHELLEVTTKIVKEGRDVLLAFRLKVDKKYGTNLRAGGSGNWLKDALKKFLWLTEKEDVIDLRGTLQTGSETIVMLVLAAIWKSNRLSSTAQAVRVGRVHALLEGSVTRAEEQLNMLRSLDEKLDSEARKTDLILSTVRSTHDQLSQMPSVVIDMKSLLSLFNSHITSQEARPRGLGTSWQQAPVTLEDALGAIVPIPLELVDSWEMFGIILSNRFERHKGHWKIQNGEYAIEDSCTGTEINRAIDWALCLRPGQKIDMSVVFLETGQAQNHCPRCRAISCASPRVRIQCENLSCGMRFQRVVDTEVPGALITVDDDPTLAQPSSSGETASKTEEPSSPGDFQHVKLLIRRTSHLIRPEPRVKRLPASLNLRATLWRRVSSLQDVSRNMATEPSTVDRMFLWPATSLDYMRNHRDNQMYAISVDQFVKTRL